jgi:glycosyltransferase involved in cell wall biosynthesis
MVRETLKIAFLIDENIAEGRFNYLLSLISGLSLIKNKRYQAIVFCSYKTDVNFFKNNKINYVRTVLLNKKGFFYYALRFAKIFFKKNLYFEFLFKFYNINILSHSDEILFSNVKKIGWIGDFQYLHYPEYFGAKSVNRHKRVHERIARLSDRVILSSNSVFIHYKKIFPSYLQKVSILNFVPNIIEPKKLLSFEDLKNKYNFSSNYYYIPNQFWKHKNHLCVIEALNLLKKKNYNPLVICSGSISDYRNLNYFNSIFKKLEKYNLNNFLILGKIDYTDVCSFIWHSTAVINPSLFEGWSTSVEESKIYNKQLILSDIDTHREQNPKKVKYFNPSKPNELAKIIYNVDMKENDNFFNKSYYVKVKANFAANYKKVIDAVV